MERDGTPYGKWLVVQTNEAIPFESIPFEAIPFESIPFASIPFESITFESIPFEAIPFEAIAFEAIPFAYPEDLIAWTFTSFAFLNSNVIFNN